MTAVARAGVLALLATLCYVLPITLSRPPDARAATVCATPVKIANGDFEAPVIPANTMVLEPEADMGGWKTNAPDKLFEHWREVRQGFTAGQGNQFVELNANFVSAVYQDLTTTEGQTLRWELKHRGRLGDDTMIVKIGPPHAPVQQGGQIKDGSAAWGTWSRNYTVPSGQTTTRFWFESISAAQNKPTYGNFLDAISFGSEPCLTTTAGVSGGGAANVGDVLTYTVATSNRGGNPAKNAVLSDDLPAGTTFVPGSIRSITGSSSATVSDGTDTDTGEYDPATRTVRVRTGVGAGASTGGSIPVGESRAFSYQVRVTSAAASTTLANEATATFFNDLTNANQTSVSTSAGTTVAAAADLGITAVVRAPGIMAGQAAATDLTVTNTGPDDANTVQVTSVVPYGLYGVAATTPLGTCTATPTAPAGPTNVSCAIPVLARGATTTVAITGTVVPQATPAAQATLTASVTSATYEVNQADNGTSVSAAVSTSTDLKVVQTYTPANPVPGDTITYTATVTNQGPSQARDILLTDPIAYTSNFVGAEIGTTPSPTPCTYTAAIGTVECAVPDMMPGTTTTVTIVVALPFPGTGTVNNAVSVSSSTPERNVADNNHSVWKTGTPEADVGVKLVLGANRAKPGDVVPFTLTVTNTGPWPATNVSFNTIVPVGFTVNRQASQYCTAGACTLPAVFKGDVIEIKGTTTVGPNVAAGLLSASTTVISPTSDPNPANDTSTVTFTIDLEADLRVTQTLTNTTPGETGLVAGHTVRGRVVVHNDGATRAEGLVLRQAVPAGRPIPFVTTSTGDGENCAYQGSGTPGSSNHDGGIYVCTRPSLAVGAGWTVTFDGVSLSRGYSGGVFTRTATISATTPDPDAADNTVTTTEPVERRSELRLTKTTVTAGPVVQTDDVEFLITVTNNGPSDAANVLVREEPQAGLVIVSGSGATGGSSYDSGALTWTIPNLAHNGTASVRVHGIAQGSGTLVDTSRIVASDSTDPVSTNNSASDSIVADPAAPALALSVTATAVPGAGGFSQGDVITYQYTVANTGNLDATGVTLTASRTGAGSGACNGGTLDAGQSVMCPAVTHQVTAAEASAAVPISNVATLVGQTAANILPVTFASVTTVSPLTAPNESLVVVVTATVSDPARQHGAAKDDLIHYDYQITNNGTVTMTDVRLTDPTVGPLGCAPIASLPPGATDTCSTPSGSRYQVTQNDIDGGTPVRNNAAVSGRNGLDVLHSFGPYHADVTVAAPDPAIVVTVVPAPSRTPVRKTDTIAYEYRVENKGNVTVGTVEVTDSRVTGVTCPATIAPNVIGVCRTRVAQPYTVAQQDIDDGGSVHNDAVVTATGVAPLSPTVHVDAGASVPVAAAAPALSLTHTVTVPPGGVVRGDVLSVVYRVENTGNVTMNGVTVADPLSGAVACPATPLPPAGDLTCPAAPYTVTQAGVDGPGPITGTARAQGRGPGQTALTDYGTDPISVAVAAGTTELSVSGSAVVTPPDHRNAVEPGDRVGFEYLVTNAGTVTMEQITAVDSLTGVVSCPLDRLAPAAQMYCTARDTYTVTAADIKAGAEIVAEAQVTANGPGRPAKTFGPARAVVAVLVPEPSLRVTTTPTGLSSPDGQAVPGDRISFRHDVVNAGNQPISGIDVTSELSGPVACPGARLATREAMTCTSGPYPVTEEDLDSGDGLAGDITVVGQAPLETTPRTFGPFPVRVGLVTAAPALRLAMTATVAVRMRALTASTGNLIAYRYTVTNSGNVTVRDIAVADARAVAVTCAATRLAPGAATTCAATRDYEVTQADVDAGGPVTATAVASGAHGTTARSVTSNTAEAAVPVAAPAPALNASQTAAWTDTDGDGRLSTRDQVVSSLKVTNKGNVTLVNIRVTGLPAAVTCTPNRAAPGETVPCVSAVYHLTDEEVARGRHTFSAQVAGDLIDSDAPPAEATAPSTVVVPARRPTPSPTATTPRIPSPSTSPTGSPAPSSSPTPGAGDVPITGGPSLPIALAGVALITIGSTLLLITYRLRTRRTVTRLN
ncbi:DUF7507 domain-containing protein [Actinoplanes utahensis]|uniref:Gram-positive cocci surface proteins LPxTG domain-containing protein n=1 Tax=Actinoplanes utahensis TaxID=1869 RepID=A0A0A6XGT2_ACTUT|nr:DUF11 domain-containing protein [Actinoplanes utahensis]KHD79282.1 hypothetical protein MB27_01410 [Actinoplanes utahensis]GIF30272.1 hypothetical protein Aut01nite_32580 [Actinoplanes utahensis]